MIGLQNFYKVTEMLKDSFGDSPYVNTITYGNIFEVDLNKQTIFPLTHIQVDNAQHNNNVITFTITIMNMDIVDISKDDVTDAYVGNDNLHDVYNTQLAVVNKFIQRVSRGDISRDGFALNGVPTSEAFSDRFEAQLAGWVTTMQIDVVNTISVC